MSWNNEGCEDNPKLLGNIDIEEVLETDLYIKLGHKADIT